MGSFDCRRSPASLNCLPVQLLSRIVNVGAGRLSEEVGCGFDGSDEIISLFKFTNLKISKILNYLSLQQWLVSVGAGGLSEEAGGGRGQFRGRCAQLPHRVGSARAHGPWPGPHGGRGPIEEIPAAIRGVPPFYFYYV